MKTVLVIGINGQDGSYLAEILLARGYDVHGLIRKTSSGCTRNIDHIIDRLSLHYGDLLDANSLLRTLGDVRPDEIYNEADQDHVGISFQTPCYNYDVTGSAVGRMLDLVKQVCPSARIFQPVTSNIFGLSPGPYNEETRIAPRSPYACAKAFALHLCHMYREVFGLYVASAIMFNHESERRSEDYVSRKITRAAARIAAGLQKELVLGNMDAQVDWGHSAEFMDAAWSLMQLDVPETVVLGTGTLLTVREFATEAFAIAGLDLDDHVRIDPTLVRPSQTAALCADASKARSLIGFQPTISGSALVKRMVLHDLSTISTDSALGMPPRARLAS